MTHLVIETVWSETRGELEGVSVRIASDLVIETVWSETGGELEGVSVRIVSDSPCHRDCLE